MRVTVGDLIKELSLCDATTPIKVQTHYNDPGSHTGEFNGVLRVDRLLGKTVIVVQHEVN